MVPLPDTRAPIRIYRNLVVRPQNSGEALAQVRAMEGQRDYPPAVDTSREVMSWILLNRDRYS